MASAREVVERLERKPEVPGGEAERFAGYGVLGLTFASGDVLCFRRWAASSLGPSYSALWHRTPAGAWTFVQDASPQLACTRYFGSAVDRTLAGDIHVEWLGPSRLRISTGPGYSVEWDMSLKATPATWLIGGILKASPDALWRWAPWLKLLGIVGTVIGGAGRVTLTGRLPNGQWFRSRPRALWAVSRSSATVEGQDLGEPGPLPEQARLEDIWIPQKGRFFVGDAFLEPLDPARHLTAISRGG